MTLVVLFRGVEDSRTWFLLRKVSAERHEFYLKKASQRSRMYCGGGYFIPKLTRVVTAESAREDYGVFVP